jgi:dTDP-4-dehydrorhamnose reductase
MIHALGPLEASLPLPLLITGVPGVPGYNALAYFRAKYPGQVFGIHQEDSTYEFGPEVLPCSAENRDRLARLFDQHQFAAVLNCAGNCALKPCELNPQLARRINVEGVRHLLAQTVPRRLRLVHLSVDLVFSGDRHALQPEPVTPGGYTEADPRDPVTVYGKTMADAEDMVLQEDPSACILRISLPMGVSLNGHAGAIDWITSRFKKSRPATLFFDEIRTPAYTDCLNRLYETILSNRLCGIFHAGGPRRLSLYQIAQIINRVGGYDPDCLMRMSRRKAPPIPPRAGDVTLDCGKLVRALGDHPLDPWPWDDALVPTHVDWHRERPSGESRSPAVLARLLVSNPARPLP